MKTLGLKQFLAAIALSIMAMIPLAPAYGQGTLLLNEYPDRYIVAESDTLWNIASQFLQDPERWPEVWLPDAYLDNADLIYPGDILRMSFVGGTPRILVQRGDRAEVQLGPQIREEALSSAIPAIPLEAIENSFTRNRIVTQELYNAAPYIVANLGDNLAIGTGDEIYARGVWPIGTGSFEVYREGRVYQDESGDRLLGIEIEYLGFATITEEADSNLRRMLVNNSSKEIRVGDRLLIREESRIDATIFPTEPVDNLQGQIIAFMGNESLASQLDTVVVDLGLEDNLAIGDILSIQKPGNRLVDEVERSRMSFRERFRTAFRRDSLQLPGEEIGTLLVYKTFDTLSYAVILSSIQPAELYQQVVRP